MGHSRRVSAQDDPAALYLVDSSIYVFRAWHTVAASLVDRDGHPANAVFGFSEFLYTLLQRRQPRYLACTFDESLGSTTRNDIYPQYKANRPPAPVDLKRQFAGCRKLAEALGISCFSSPRFEADDIIGTLANSARAQQTACVIVSADKDLCQFIGPRDSIWDFARDTWLDSSRIENRFGVKPTQIADWLALCGDKVDNIPGIPGVGQTTAARLLIKWGNLDTLFSNIDKVASMKFRGAMRTASLLRDHEEQVRLARQLTGLLTVPDVNFNPAEFQVQPDQGALVSALQELNFSQASIDRWITGLTGFAAA